MSPFGPLGDTPLAVHTPTPASDILAATPTLAAMERAKQLSRLVGEIEHARSSEVVDAELAARLRQPLDLEAFLALAADYGCSVTEADVLEAQQREQSARSAEDLQHEQAGESRRLRSFIQG